MSIVHNLWSDEMIVKVNDRYLLRKRFLLKNKIWRFCIKLYVKRIIWIWNFIVQLKLALFELTLSRRALLLYELTLFDRLTLFLSRLVWLLCEITIIFDVLSMLFNKSTLLFNGLTKFLSRLICLRCEIALLFAVFTKVI